MDQLRRRHASRQQHTRTRHQPCVCGSSFCLRRFKLEEVENGRDFIYIFFFYFFYFTERLRRRNKTRVDFCSTAARAFFVFFFLFHWAVGWKLEEKVEHDDSTSSSLNIVLIGGPFLKDYSLCCCCCCCCCSQFLTITTAAGNGPLVFILLLPRTE